jgi:hypothetical protein
MLALVASLTAPPVGAQVAIGDVSVQTRGPCSPVAIDVAGNVTINNNCTLGLTEEDLRRIVVAIRGGLGARCPSPMPLSNCIEMWRKYKAIWHK